MEQPARRFGLRTKLLLTITSLLVFVISLVTLLVSQSMRSIIDEETRKRGLSVARLFGATNLNHLKSYNRIATYQNAHLAKKENQLLYVVVYDKEGRIAADTESLSTLYSFPKDENSLAAISASDEVFQKIPAPPSLAETEGSVFEIIMPVKTAETPYRWGTVRMGISPRGMNKSIRDTQMKILAIGALSLLLGLAGSRSLASRITTPVSKLVEGSLRAAGGDLHSRIHLSSGDELEELAANFNYMIDQIQQNQDQRIRSEKMAVVGHMVNTIVHDCRTPITVIKGFSSLMQEFDVSEEQRKEGLRFINFEVDRMERMLEEILHFSIEKQTTLTLAAEDVDNFLKDCCTEIKFLFGGTEISLVAELGSESTTLFDQDKIRRAILNIAANAKDALNGRGEFRIRSGRAGEFVSIELSDNGKGIPERMREHVFDPFFTHGKASGIGLGMSITRKIIEDHQGKISLASETGRGTSFLIQLPLHLSASLAKAMAGSTR